MLATRPQQPMASAGLTKLLAAYPAGEQSELQQLFVNATPEGQRLVEAVLKITSRVIGVSQDGPCKRVEAAVAVPDAATLKQVCRIHALTFLMPLRKKLHMQLYSESLHLNNVDTNTPELRVTYDQIRKVVVLPTPEKVKATWTFVMLGAREAAHIAWALPDSQDVDIVLADKTVASRLADIPDHASRSKEVLVKLLDSIDGLPKVDLPDAGFKNGRREPYVKCYLKGKDGYLFLLLHGIIFGLKKPIIYIPFEEITDIQTQSTSSSFLMCTRNSRTFDMVVETTEGRYEFSTMDASDQPAIDHFISRSRSALKTGQNKRQQASAKGSSPDTIGNKRAKTECEAGAEEGSHDSDVSSEDEDYDPSAVSDDDDPREEYSTDVDSESDSGSGSGSGSGDEEQTSGSEDDASVNDAEESVNGNTRTVQSASDSEE